MKTISFFRLVLALGLLPATLGAQSSVSNKNHKATANYYAEFAELMHSETAAKSALVTSPSVNSFDAFVYYREVMKGRAGDFIADYEAMAASILNYVQCRVRQLGGQPQGLPNPACKKAVVASSTVQ